VNQIDWRQDDWTNQSFHGTTFLWVETAPSYMRSSIE
jgi:hypothetical protein